MKIMDCLPVMTKMYLVRIVDSILKDDIPRGDDARLREQINQNLKELSSPERIREVLALERTAHSQRILTEAVLRSLLFMPEMAASEEGLFEAVQEFEKGILQESDSADAFNFSNEHSIDIYREVLDVALQDGTISPDESSLLEKLRKKLGVSRREHLLLEAKLGSFPKPGNLLHSFSECQEALKHLQTDGILLYCNKADGGPIVVLPEEIAPAVKKVLGFELSPAAQKLLHDALSTNQLYAALQEQNLPLSGTKEARSQRLLDAGVKPSEVLGSLKNDELTDLCRRLPGLAVSGSKQDKIERVIQHFDSLICKEPESSDDPREKFYQYFEEIAARENSNLYQLKIIKHDRDMEAGFEEGTRFLFEMKLGCPLVSMAGNEHADGCVQFKNGELLLWDNKGKESIYKFPKKHFDQFKRYIRESVTRVNVFLVIVPEIDPQSKLQAMRLKQESGTDTDVALIAAEDLKFVAENWKKHAPSGKFSLEVFNTTGILDRAVLEERMKVFLK